MRRSSGRSSLLLPPLVRRWPIFASARSASATQVAPDRRAAAGRFAAVVARVARFGVDPADRLAQGGDILLGHHYVFSDAGNRAGRLVRRSRNRPPSRLPRRRLGIRRRLAGRGRFYFWAKTLRTALFWAAFILIRPLGATVGDFSTSGCCTAALH